MSSETEQRRLAAIMFTDMVGYSALSQNNPNVAVELLEEHRQILCEIFPKFNGTEIKTIGDAFLVEFNSALTRPTANRTATDPPSMAKVPPESGTPFPGCTGGSSEASRRNAGTSPPEVAQVLSSL